MSPSRTIGTAALLVSGGILLSRVLGYLRTVVIGAQLGINVESDLYTAAFAVPDYLFFLMAGGYLSVTLVPILAAHLADGDDEAARASFTAVFRVVAILVLVITVGALVFAGPITRFAFPRFGPEESERLVGMMRIALTSQVFFLGGTLLMAAQYATKRFLVPTMAPLIYNLGIIAGGLLGAAGGDPTPEAFMWGGLVGAAVGNFGLQWWGARRAGFWPVGGVPFRHPAVVEYLTLAFPLMIGQSVVALDEQWPRLFGQFAGEGAQAGLTFARQLNMLPVGVIAQAAGVAAFPFLAALAAENRMADLRNAVTRSVRGAVVVGALAGGLVTALSVPIVRVAFQYGRFETDDTTFVASMLVYYALSIPFWAAHQVYTRAFYSLRRMWTPVLIGTVVTGLVIPLMFVFVDTWGAAGVAGLSSAGVAIYTVAIAVAWHRSESREDAGSTAWFATRVALAALAAGAAAVGIGGVLERSGWTTTPALALGGILGAVVYVGVLRLLGVSELTEVASKIRSRIRRA